MNAWFHFGAYGLKPLGAAQELFMAIVLPEGREHQTETSLIPAAATPCQTTCTSFLPADER